MIRAVALLSLATASCGECGADPGGDDLRPSPAASASGFEPIASATPGRSYYVERSGDKCTLYSTLGGERSAASPVRCPKELDPGERVRLMGQTCMRESADATRNVPMRCPKWLSWAARGVGGK